MQFLDQLTTNMATKCNFLGRGDYIDYIYIQIELGPRGH